MDRTRLRSPLRGAEATVPSSTRSSGMVTSGLVPDNVAAELMKMQRELDSVAEDLATARSRAQAAREERRVRCQELLDDVAAQRERTRRLGEVLDGAVMELRDEVGKLKREHDELVGDLQGLIQHMQNSLKAEGEARLSTIGELQARVQDLDAQVEAETAKREQLVEIMRDEAMHTMEAQVMQESQALEQGVQFIHEVRVALDQETAERSRRDQAIRANAEFMEGDVSRVRTLLEDTADTLQKEITGRSESFGAQGQEVAEVQAMIAQLQHNLDVVGQPRAPPAPKQMGYVTHQVQMPGQSRISAPSGVTMVHHQRHPR
eukprot:gnl/TRDRNA2_/TRDRNA2_188873_c0_seq1.p1 gnl/TRDRNA2_/TRDRNA2_188873_c0~~gnl/TRDRNA2_/TRDRNA2_188873_c0_seq1.p1  ORF type:complete len:337 (-),score=76.09 gnl/TRDRNA2_/TRDRNA2_188873_c0_seq1:164-1120(-)